MLVFFCAHDPVHLTVGFCENIQLAGIVPTEANVDSIFTGEFFQSLSHPVD